MSTPAIIMLVLIVIGLLLSANKHGKPKKTDKENFWISLIAYGIQLGLLYWGGFFN